MKNFSVACIKRGETVYLAISVRLLAHVPYLPAIEVCGEAFGPTWGYCDYHHDNIPGDLPGYRVRACLDDSDPEKLVQWVAALLAVNPEEETGPQLLAAI